MFLISSGLIFLVLVILPFVLTVCVFREAREDRLCCGAGCSSGLNTRWGLRKKRYVCSSCCLAFFALPSWLLRVVLTVYVVRQPFWMLLWLPSMASRSPFSSSLDAPSLGIVAEVSSRARRLLITSWWSAFFDLRAAGSSFSTAGRSPVESMNITCI